NEQYAKAQPIKDAKAWEETSKRLPRQWQEAVIINMQ
ncbi:ABC transporter substrate-binding protein, partial [Pseudomonas aeruginosa]